MVTFASMAINNGSKEGTGKNSTNTSNSALNTSNTLPNTSEYRGDTNGTSSGFHSDLDSDSQFYSSDIDSDASSDPPLIWSFHDYFSNLPGNDWCVRVPQSFIDDEFNLFELPDVFKCPLTLTDKTEELREFDEYAFDDLIDFVTIEDLTGKHNN